MTSRYLTIQKLKHDDKYFDYLIHFDDNDNFNKLLFKYDKYLLPFNIIYYNINYKISYTLNISNTDTDNLLLKFDENIDLNEYLNYLKTLDTDVYVSDFKTKIIKLFNYEFINKDSILFIKSNVKINYKTLISPLLSRHFNHKIITNFFYYSFSLLINCDFNKCINNNYLSYNEYEDKIKMENEKMKKEIK